MEEPVNDTNPGLRGIGDNNPPDAIEILRSNLTEKTTGLRERAKALIAAEGKVPEIKDDDVAAKVTDMIRLTTAAISAATDEFTKEKKPYLDGGRAVDGFFKEITTPLADMKARLNNRLATYLDDKAEAERRAALERERLAREEAERKAKEAAEAEAANKPAEAEALIESAIKAENVAEIAAARVDAPVADLTRVRGTTGGTASLSRTMVGTIVNRDKLDLGKLRPYIALDALQKALNAYVRAGGTECDGATIAPQSRANVR